MSDTFKVWLRWIILIPICVIYAIFGLFILHWVLIFTLGKIIKPMPELPEILLTPFVATFAFTFAVYSFSPDLKLRSSYIAGIVLLLGIFAFVIIAWSGGTYFGNELYLKNGGVQTVMAISGVIVAWLISNKKHKNKK